MPQVFSASNKLFSTLAGTCLGMLFLQLDTNAQAASRTYMHRNADGTVIFSDFPLHDGSFVRQRYMTATRPTSAINPCDGLSSAALAERGRRLDREFLTAASAFGVDAALIKAVARAESCFDPHAVSGAGAKGLMQLMPATASEMGVRDIFNARQNLRGGADYLARMLHRYANDTDLALAAYNAGPGNVEKYKGIPPFPETIKYIKSVRKFQQQYAPLSNTD